MSDGLDALVVLADAVFPTEQYTVFGPEVVDVPMSMETGSGSVPSGSTAPATPT
ncbi:hypothetical protein ABZ442_14890 [Streptomyces triculaminicus]|uniref:hypothetical protein n=1 Tax=Streptomyces triculaminicus TaxID=2816232 RepID=UPI0033F65EAA